LLVNMRSSDLILGITYDIPAFTLMQELMLLELNARGLDLKLGRYMHVSNSLHVYERHFEMLDKIANVSYNNLVASGIPPMPKMPSSVPYYAPWRDLDCFQESYREGQRLLTIDRDVKAFDHDQIEYFGDWARILAIHSARMRLLSAKKAGDDLIMQDNRKVITKLRAELQFEGYRAFKR